MTPDTDYEAEARDAQARVDALLERIRGGDETVTTEELDSARKLAEFAQLRVEAAERKAWEAGRDAAAEAQREAAERVREVLGANPNAPTAEIVALQKKAAKAIDALFNAVETRWADSFRAARRLRLANETAARYDLPDSAAAHGVSYDPVGERFRVVNERGSTASVHWRHLLEPEQWVVSVLSEAGIQIDGSVALRSTRKVELTLEDR